MFSPHSFPYKNRHNEHNFSSHRNRSNFLAAQQKPPKIVPSFAQNAFPSLSKPKIRLPEIPAEPLRHPAHLLFFFLGLGLVLLGILPIISPSSPARSIQKKFTPHLQWIKGTGEPSLQIPMASFPLPSQRYEIWQAGNQRKDILTSGDFSSRNIFLRLVVQNNPVPTYPSTAPISMFVDMARESAESGLSVIHSSPRRGVQTHLGRFEAVDLQIGREGEARPCLGFRLSALHFSLPSLGQDWMLSPLQISGFFCPAAEPESAVLQVACLLDNLYLPNTSSALYLALEAPASSSLSDCEENRGGLSQTAFLKDFKTS